MSEQNLQQLLSSNQFTEAFAKLSAGEKISKDLQSHQKTQIFDNLFKAEQYEIINHLVKDKTIETDIYEFDSFDKSIFQNVVRHIKADENGLAFFKDFISKFDNLNDEVSKQTLLSYFLEKLMPIEFIKILIDAGCDVNFKTNAEENYIFQVVKNNQKRFDLSDDELATLQKNYIELFVQEGVDVDGENVVQKTALLHATEFKKIALLTSLLENGANANHVDNLGNSAFFYAVAQQQSLEMYNILSQFTSAQFDVLNKSQVSILFEYLRMMPKSEQGLALLIKLINDGADLYQTNIYYSKETTPLNLIGEKPADILEAVLATGLVDVNRNDSQGNTLLHKICAYNVNYEAEKAKETYRKVKLLIEHGADIAVTNDQDQTALMLASDDNLKIKTVELLMKQNA